MTSKPRFGAPESVPFELPFKCDRCGADVRGELASFHADHITRVPDFGPREPTEFEATYTGWHVCAEQSDRCPHIMEPRYSLGGGGNPVSAKCRFCGMVWPLGEPGR